MKRDFLPHVDTNRRERHERHSANRYETKTDQARSFLENQDSERDGDERNERAVAASDERGQKRGAKREKRRPTTRRGDETRHHQGLHDDLRRRGLARVDEFSWDRSIARVREIYDEVLRS